MEDTDIQETTTKDEAVEGWLNAEKAKAPEGSMRESIIRDSSMPEGVGMRYHSLEEAGLVYVYHQKTGDRSKINRNMLQQQLLKILEDGSRTFGLHPPKDKDGNVIKPFVGKIKCLLHKDDKDRGYYDSLGFAYCPREGIPSLHALRQHMSKKHRVEWETIEEKRKDAERKEDRDLQRSIYSKLIDNKVEDKAPLYVSDKDKENK